jgi:hypothetical protein
MTYPSCTVLFSIFSTGGLDKLILLLTTKRGLLFFKTSSFKDIPSKYYFNKLFNNALSFYKASFCFSIANLSKRT